MGMLNNAVERLVSSIVANEGELITLARGSDAGTWTATKGKAELYIDSQSTAILEGIDASFIGATDEYVVDGSETEPQRNDILTDSDGSKWEVTPVQGIGCFRETRGMLRAFVKRVVT